jgi:hypothetical protein
MNIRRGQVLLVSIVLAAAAISGSAKAQDGSDEAAASAGQHPPFVLGAYVEAFYQLNFNLPVNGITNFRGFDNRHNSLTLSNVALDVQWDAEDLIGRVTLQVGHTPSTYYLSEPSSPGAAGANTSNAELWKYLQQAYAGYRFDVGAGLEVTAGVFLSPTGPEAMAVHDSWNWSRSNLFVGLPFYHTGARAAYRLSEPWTFTLAAYNGWNSVVDNNGEKSLAAHLVYTQPKLTVSMLYFGGVERPRAAPEGRGWRHLADAHATWQASSWLALIAHGNVGFEPTHFGLSAWQAAALYARMRVAPPFYIALRADTLREQVPEGASGLFFPASWVTSGTVTLDYRPHDRVSLRLEYRHDRASGRIYFRGNAANAPSARSQNTLTLGITSWF